MTIVFGRGSGSADERYARDLAAYEKAAAAARARQDKKREKLDYEAYKTEKAAFTPRSQIQERRRTNHGPLKHCTQPGCTNPGSFKRDPILKRPSCGSCYMKAYRMRTKGVG